MKPMPSLIKSSHKDSMVDSMVLKCVSLTTKLSPDHFGTIWVLKLFPHHTSPFLIWMFVFAVPLTCACCLVLTAHSHLLWALMSCTRQFLKHCCLLFLFLNHFTPFISGFLTKLVQIYLQYTKLGNFFKN